LIFIMLTKLAEKMRFDVSQIHHSFAEIVKTPINKGENYLFEYSDGVTPCSFLKEVEK
jgi:hypothetical protein